MGLVADLEEWAASVELDPEPMSTPSGLSDRQLDYWEPLLVVAEAAGGDWPKRAREAASHLAGRKISDEPSLKLLLLRDLHEIWGEDPHLFSSTICERLCALPEAPWGDYKGREFNQRDLARLLKLWDVSSRDVRIGGEVRKGYVRDELQPKWVRYLGSEISATSATRATPQVATTRTVADVADVALLQGSETDLVPCSKCGIPKPVDAATCWECGEVAS